MNDIGWRQGVVTGRKTGQNYTPETLSVVLLAKLYL